MVWSLSLWFMVFNFSGLGSGGSGYAFSFWLEAWFFSWNGFLCLGYGICVYALELEFNGSGCRVERKEKHGMSCSQLHKNEMLKLAEFGLACRFGTAGVQHKPEQACNYMYMREAFFCTMLILTASWHNWCMHACVSLNNIVTHSCAMPSWNMLYSSSTTMYAGLQIAPQT